MQIVLSSMRLVLVGIGISMVMTGAVAPAARTVGFHRTAVGGSMPPIETVEFERAPDGLFYVSGLVNGHTVRFLVDTGASVVMLTRADALAVGLDLKNGAFQSRVRTANGASAMAWTTLQDINIAGRQLSRIDAAVPQNGLPVSLLGQNLLRKLGVLTIDGDYLRVHNRVASLDF